MSDALPPPCSLDLPATRTLAAHYAAEVARGVAETTAWTAAVEAFGGLHPAWPKSLVEREAARVVGGLTLLRLDTGRPGHQLRTSPPSRDLRLALVTPWLPVHLHEEARETEGWQQVFAFARMGQENDQALPDAAPEAPPQLTPEPCHYGAGSFRGFVARRRPPGPQFWPN